MLVKVQNDGFYRIERLPGNIGYVDLRQFFDPAYAANTASNAMQLLANSEAIIFDLRYNRGGNPRMVAYLISYFVNEQPVHLNTFHSRSSETVIQSWTFPFVQSERIGTEKPLFILTSKRTASAAEEFTYNLKHLQRATLIGETTAGAANPGRYFQIDEHFKVFIPTGRPVNTISKTNWEGIGIEPDIVTNKEDAFYRAYIKALNITIEKYKGIELFESLVLEANGEIAKIYGIE